MVERNDGKQRLLTELLGKPVEVHTHGTESDYTDEGVLVEFDEEFLKLRGEDLRGRTYFLYLNRDKVRLVKWKDTERR
jgi:hypothetical protein